MNESDDSADGALNAIAYLSRSENRVNLLRELSTTRANSDSASQGASSRDLRERTGVSRATVARTLTEFEERGWVRKTSTRDYSLTPKGSHLATEFISHIEAVVALQTLGEAVAVLPHDELDIGLHHFADATVRDPMSTDPADLGRYLTGLLEDATTFYWLSYIGPPASMDEVVQDGVLSGRLTAEGAISASLVEHYRERFPADRRRLWQRDQRLEPHTDTGLRLYRYEGRLPCNLFVIDETTVIENSQVADIPPGTIIESRNEPVRTWAVEMIEAYIEESEQVDPFPAE